MDVRLDQFKVGDVLRVVGELEEVIIEKIWLATQGPYRWVDYEGRTRRSRRRLIIGAEYDDGEWETVLYDRFPEPYEIASAERLPGTISLDGMTFRREEQGRCSLRLVSDDGPEISCTYADYTGPDEQVLSIEVFGGDAAGDVPTEVEVFVGRSIAPTDVQLHLPVDTAPRTGLLRAAHSDGEQPTTFGRRQVVIAAVAFAVILLFAIMALQ